ncbi:MAG: transcription/translation regulatory transformer protein RfaH [Porticoccaceae bacterium]|nr:transcription/translation regulatory transformer protein RfaH [Porticoccaceae bacterium]
MGMVKDNWFLLQTKSKQESRAVENLERQGVHSFCPMMRIEKVSRGSRVVKREALFPGYLFVNFDNESVSSSSIRSTRGVSQFVTCAGAPIKVPESLIAQLRLRTDPSNDELFSDLPKQGDRLQVVDGPFRGLNAVFSQPDGDARAIVLINLLNQQVSASLPFSSLVAKDSGNDD